MEQVRGALPRRGRLISEQGHETFVVAIVDKLVKVGDKVGPRMERRWPCSELDDESFGSECGKPAGPRNDVELALQQQPGRRADQVGGIWPPFYLNERDVWSKTVGQTSCGR